MKNFMVKIMVKIIEKLDNIYHYNFYTFWVLLNHVTILSLSLYRFFMTFDYDNTMNILDMGTQLSLDNIWKELVYETIQNNIITGFTPNPDTSFTSN